MKGRCAPTDRSRRDEVAAAISPHAPRRMPLLADDGTRLLAAMFADADVCRRDLESLMAEGFSRDTLTLLLQILIKAGFVSKERGVSRAPNTYRLLQPPRRQP
jgi:hypothetical protein